MPDHFHQSPLIHKEKVKILKFQNEVDVRKGVSKNLLKDKDSKIVFLVDVVQLLDFGEAEGVLGHVVKFPKQWQSTEEQIRVCAGSPVDDELLNEVGSQ